MTTYKQKAVRVSVDLPLLMHRNIKLTCVEDGISMHDCVVKALEAWYNDRMDLRDLEIALKQKKDIAEHGSLSLEEWERQHVQD